jgi:protein-S-isoprenylcysteine O-methyltransferase Ste14
VVRDGFFTVYLISSLVLIVIRDKAVTFSSRITDYMYTLLGLGAPLLFQPASAIALLVGVFFEVVGTVLVLGGFFSLNKSFGLGPENRGIKTGGAYRFVRHPMYSGYMLAEVGFVLNNFSLFNFAVLVMSILFLLLRMRAEERLLLKDRSYKKYARTVRWRIMPFLF